MSAGLLRNSLLWFEDKNFATHLSGLPYKVSYTSLSVSPFVLVLALVDVVLAVF
jgi:hypothetical protein